VRDDFVAPQHLTGDVRWQYDGVCQREVPEETTARRTAEIIENTLTTQGWPVGAVFGPEARLADNLSTSQRGLRPEQREG